MKTFDDYITEKSSTSGEHQWLADAIAKKKEKERQVASGQKPVEKTNPNGEMSLKY
jgi:hypothetical protein